MKPTVREVYKIVHIHPQCSWYAERHYFENKLMRCTEVFDDDDATGFCFVNASDCPGMYHPLHAFCFHAPELAIPRKANKTTGQEAA